MKKFVDIKKIKKLAKEELTNVKGGDSKDKPVIMLLYGIPPIGSL